MQDFHNDFDIFLGKFKRRDININKEFLNIIYKKIHDDKLDKYRLKYWDILVLLNQLRLSSESSSKLKDNIPNIYYILTHEKHLFLNDDQITKIKDIYKSIDHIINHNKFKKYILFPYLLFKICELLGYHDFVERFNYFFQRSLLQELDIMWEFICMQKHYNFILSTNDPDLFII